MSQKRIRITRGHTSFILSRLLLIGFVTIVSTSCETETSTSESTELSSEVRSRVKLDYASLSKNQFSEFDEQSIFYSELFLSEPSPMGLVGDSIFIIDHSLSNNDDGTMSVLKLLIGRDSKISKPDTFKTKQISTSEFYHCHRHELWEVEFYNGTDTLTMTSPDGEHTFIAKAKNELDDLHSMILGLDITTLNEVIALSYNNGLSSYYFSEREGKPGTAMKKPESVNLLGLDSAFNSIKLERPIKDGKAIVSLKTKVFELDFGQDLSTEYSLLKMWLDFSNRRIISFHWDKSSSVLLIFVFGI